MSAFLARVAGRALGRGNAMRPAVNRYLIAVRADDAGDALAATDTATVRPERDSRNVDAALSVARYDAPAPSDVDAARSSRANEAPERTAASADSAAAFRLVPARQDHSTSTRAAGEALEREPAQAKRAPPSTPVQAGSDDRPVVASPPLRNDPRLLPLERPQAVAASGIIEHVAAGAAEPPTVHVHIGRIDVRAVDAPQPKGAPERSAQRGPSLAEHLRARERNLR
jgi:hypothetical protein